VDGWGVCIESEQIENLPGEWRARETYEQASDDEFTETFELASPGKPFETYRRTRLRRVRQRLPDQDQAGPGLPAK